MHPNPVIDVSRLSGSVAVLNIDNSIGGGWRGWQISFIRLALLFYRGSYLQREQFLFEQEPIFEGNDGASYEGFLFVMLLALSLIL